MLIVPAHAKLNLALAITGRRDDGLHVLASLVVRLDLHDLVGVDVGSKQSQLRVTTDVGDGVPDLGDPRANLAIRAAAAAGAPSAAIWLHKRVPAAAGLGGGSADAAAVLNALLPPADAFAAAPALGSDVSALLVDGAVIVGGAGEQVAPTAAPSLDVVVAFAGPGSTAAAYAAVGADEFGAGERVTALAARLRDGVFDDDLAGSALEPAACRASPALASAIAAVRAAEPRRWHLTGSGGALFCVAHEREDAHAVAGRLRARGVWARACRTRAS